MPDYDLRTLPRPSDDQYIVTSEGIHVPEDRYIVKDGFLYVRPETIHETPQEPTHLAIQGEERGGLRLHWLGILFLGGVFGLMLYDWLK